MKDEGMQNAKCKMKNAWSVEREPWTVKIGSRSTLHGSRSTLHGPRLSPLHLFTPSPLQFFTSTVGPAAASAAVLWAALPPWGLWPLAWIAPLGWIALVQREHLAGRHPYRTLYLVGVAFWLAALHWLRLPYWATGLGWIALSAYLGVYLPLFVGLSRVAVHRLRIPVILAVPTVFAGLELARAHGLTGFTMGSLAHTQIRWLALIQLSDLFGEYGVDFVIMFVAACLGRMLGQIFVGMRRPETRAAVPLQQSRNKFVSPLETALTPCPSPASGRGELLWGGALLRMLVSPRTWWPLLPAAAMVAAAVAYGSVRMSGSYTSPGAGGPDSSLDRHGDQGGPGPGAEVYAHCCRLSRDAMREAAREHREPDVLVWPETMFRWPLVTIDADARVPEGVQCPEAEFHPRIELAAEVCRKELELLTSKLGVPMIVGIDACHYAVDRVHFFNTALLVDCDGRIRAGTTRCTR